MAISINIIESNRQIIAGIPEYISVSVDGVPNAIVYFTFDGTAPDQTGASLTTFIMEHAVGDPLHGTIFLPVNTNLLDLNMLAVGANPSDVTTFYRRYGLGERHIGIGRPGIKKPVSGGTGYTTTPSPNITSDGKVIASDGYTTGSITHYDLTGSNVDGYDDGYLVATSGQQTTIPDPTYDHVIGYTDSNNPDGYVTTTLTPGQELNLVKLTDRGNIFVVEPDPSSPLGSKLVSQDDLPNIDPRGTTVVDSDGQQIEVIPIQDEQPGYTINVSANVINSDFDNGPLQDIALFTGGGIYNPNAAYIQIDGRVDGYINGQPIQPGDRVMINKPYGELRYTKKREDLGDAVRATRGYISGGLVCPIYDYVKGQAAFYYWDNHDNRWVVSLQKITPPQYEIFAKRNGVVVGQVFKWITGKRQTVPG